MLNSQLARRNSRVRLTLLFTLLLGLVLSTLVTLPLSSCASRASSVTPAGSNSKRSRPQFVPGQVLVRYKNEKTARRQQTELKALSIENRSIPIQVEKFEGSDLVEGLRLGHVADDDT